MDSNNPSGTLMNGHLTVQRNADYTYRVPTPPRIIIPPPLLNVESNPNIHIGHLVPPQSQNLDLNYLKDIDIKGFIAQRNILDWSYIKRREAQPIMPFIYLGPFSTVKDKGYLQRECITMVLAVRYTHSFYSTTVNAVAKVADEMGIGYDCVDIADNQDLIQKFPQATRIINKHLSDAHARMGDGSLPKVLVFCENGNERSATVVAAYLMEMFPALNHIKAMQVCQAQRFCVNYEDGLKHLLSSYWDILVARRAVASMDDSTPDDNATNTSMLPLRTTGPPTPAGGSRMSKRSLDEAYEEMDLDNGESSLDAQRFEDRRQFTPFGQMDVDSMDF